MTLLIEMSAVMPHQAAEKEKKKEGEKEAIEGHRPRGPLDSRFGETQAPSSLDGELGMGGDGEDTDSSQTKKWVASEDDDEDQPPPALKRQRRAKVALSDDNLYSAEESETSKEVPQRNPGLKPPS